MITLEEFKAHCLTRTAEEIVDQVLMADDALHVSADKRTYLSGSLAETFGIEQSSVLLRIIGSAKLGFSLTEKRKNGETLPRYRLFTAASDIDTAIVCPRLFEIIWDDLSIYAHGTPWMPWNSGRLGDYMVYGWLRPDHFPAHQRIRRCDDWWDLFHRLSRDSQFERHSVRGGLFFSVSDLRRYLRRSVIECIQHEQEQA